MTTSVKISFIYAITDGRHVKIGKADDVEKRIKQLQTGCPTELTLLASNQYREAKSVETVFHKCYRRFKSRIRSEWFDLPDAALKSVLDLIRRGEIPDRDEDIKWEGAISPCPQCRGRAYQNGWCLECGASVPKSSAKELELP